MTHQHSAAPTLDESAKHESTRKKKQKVSFLKLFAFADGYDYLLMLVGSLGACVHGASVPIFFIFFGKMINIIGLAYLFPKEASHQVGMVCAQTLFFHNTCAKFYRHVKRKNSEK